MRKVIGVLLSLAVMAAAAAFSINQFTGRSPGDAAASPAYPLTTMSSEIFAGMSLTAETWAGPREGFLAEDAVRAIAEQRGEIAEMQLVSLSAGTPGRWGGGNVQLLRAAADGPVWAVVYADRPHLEEASPDATIFVNVRFLNPRTGKTIEAWEAAIVED
jgi:hypothetical protein